MKIPLCILALTLLSGCAGMEHAVRTSAALNCSDNWGTYISKELRTQANCPRGTPEERWGAAPSISTGATLTSHTVILPSGAFQIIRSPSLTSVSRLSRSSK